MTFPKLIHTPMGYRDTIRLGSLLGTRTSLTNTRTSDEINDNTSMDNRNGSTAMCLSCLLDT